MSACQPLPHLQNQFHLLMQHVRVPCPSISPGVCSLSFTASEAIQQCLSPLSAFAVSLCPASFVLQGQTCLCTPGSLLTSYFCTPIPYDEKDFLVLVPEGLVGLQSFSFFGISGWGVDLDYCEADWFALK